MKGKNYPSPLHKYILLLEKYRHVLPENLCILLGQRPGLSAPEPCCVDGLEGMDPVAVAGQWADWHSLAAWHAAAVPVAMAPVWSGALGLLSSMLLC